MIKGILEMKDGRKTLLLAITEGNVERLKKDMPIHFNCEQMGVPEIRVQEVLVAYFKTIEDAKEYFISRIGMNITMTEDDKKPF